MKKKKSEQGFLKEVKGSLSRRIFLISLVFLALPLALFSGFIYLEEVKSQKKSNLFTLNVLADEAENLLIQIVESEKDFLNSLGLFSPDENQLKVLASREGLSALFHLNEQNRCDISSDSALKDEDFSSLFQGKELIALGTPRTFYVKKGSFVATFSLKRLIDKLDLKRNLPKQATLSLVSYQSKAKNQEQLIQVQREIFRTNFALNISFPTDVNFVDLPHLLRKIITLFLGIVIIGGGMNFIIMRMFSSPLKELCLVMRRVGGGDLSSRFSMRRMGFEINGIGVIFNQMVESLLGSIKKVEKEKIKKETLENELLLGRHVQHSLLVDKPPPFDSLDMAVEFTSAKEVGGDFYDFLLKDNQLMVVIGDVSGKGIYACLYSLSIRSILRSYGEVYDDLKEIISRTNDLFCKDTGDSGVFATAFVLLFNKGQNKIHFSNCGHFPAFLRKKDGTLKKLTTEGMALGVVPLEQVSIGSTELEKGETLLLFTDGAVEAHDKKMEMFGEDRLVQIFHLKEDQEAQDLLKEIKDEVFFFAKGCEQHDDLTLLVIRKM